MTGKKWLAVAVLATIGLPLCIYIIVQKVQPYWPRTDPRLLTSAQFEKAFNEQMAEHGLSVNLSGAYGYSGSRAAKTAKVDCVDGSEIVCRLGAREYRGNAIISAVYLEQTLTGEASETIYLKPLTEMLLNVFEPPLAADKDGFGGKGRASFNEVMAACDDLLSGKTDELDLRVFSGIVSDDGVRYSDTIHLARINTDGQEILLARIYVVF